MDERKLHRNLATKSLLLSLVLLQTRDILLNMACPFEGLGSTVKALILVKVKAWRW